MVNKVKAYFENFGVVDDVRFHTRDTFQYGFVQFNSADDASTILSQRSHRIANWNVKVKAADFWHQPAIEKPNPLLIAPDQESPSHILNALDEDCLSTIFEYMNVKTLTNAAEVCVRFNNHAKRAFAKNHAKLELIDGFLKSAEMKKLFKNFGSIISTLRVDELALRSVNDFWSVANEYLTPRLKSLELVNFTLNGSITAKLRPLFQTLEEFRFMCGDLNVDGKSLMDACVNLKALGLYNCTIGYGNCIKRKFEKLEEAHIVETCGVDVIDFIKLNPTLKKLRVIDNGVDLTKLVQTIGTSLPNLVQLEIEEESASNKNKLADNLPILSQLTSLKDLTLNFDSVEIEALMKNLAEKKVPIEKLKIINGKINDDAISSISKLTNVKVLEFVSITEKLTDEYLVQLAKEMPELQELRLEKYSSEITTIGLKKMLPHAKKLSLLVLKSIDSITVDVDDYKAMLKSVQSRSEKVKLRIELTSSGDKVNVPDTILAENRDIFYIDETINIVPSIFDFIAESLLDNSDFDDYNDDDLDDDEWYYDSDDGGYHFGNGYVHYFD